MPVGCLKGRDAEESHLKVSRLQYAEYEQALPWNSSNLRVAVPSRTMKWNRKNCKQAIGFNHRTNHLNQTSFIAMKNLIKTLLFILKYHVKKKMSLTHFKLFYVENRRNDQRLQLSPMAIVILNLTKLLCADNTRQFMPMDVRSAC